MAKRLSQTEVDKAAAAILRTLICQHGSKGANRVSLALRRQARACLATIKDTTT